MGNDIILEARKITKVYPGTVALAEVDYAVRRGKVNVIIGENGAGKSTLMKIIAGVEQSTSGNLYINGIERHYHSPADALKAGVGIIHQELNLFPDLDISENVFMSREIIKRPYGIDHKAQQEETEKLLSRLKLSVKANTLVKELRVGQQQIVEIAKVLSQNASIIIMDEPTSALSQEETGILFDIIRELKSHGVSIIYISHRLEEIMHIGDFISILRDGQLVAEEEVANIDIPWIIANMTGGNTIEPITSDRSIGEVVLEAKGIRLIQDDGKTILDDISFKLHRGEILGIYGLRGAGRTELLECLLGAQTGMSGELVLEGKQVRSKSISKRIQDGFALIPEDRKNQGIFTNMAIMENMTISSLQNLSRYSLINERKEVKTVESMMGQLNVKASGRKAMINSLSGGNQQKIVIGKSLLTNLKVLLMDEPTRGIDIAAKHEVFSICESLAQKGISILFVSSEMQEMLAIPDRILVLSDGSIQGEFSRAEATEEKLVHASASQIAAAI